MYFNTLEYFGFFIATLLLVRYSPKPATVLLAASGLFYVVAGWFDTTLIVCLVAVNWLLIRWVASRNTRVVLAVTINIGVLVAIKYRVFLAGGMGLDHTTFIDTVLPLGISFYTFQLLAYQIDAARDPRLGERNVGPFALFIMFFPQLIAGPIVRARQLMPQIQRMFDGNRRALRLYTYGLALCVLGLTKKVVFADSLAPVVDDIFYLGPATMAQAWTGAWLFAFQIFFDFSGYSDIAIGSAYLFGIRLPINFRTPYLSVSPREFWQRWHITLSTWIRDYLYIPLGGGKGPQARQLIVLLLVMGIAGLWHGANTSFIVWGILWGGYIGLHRVLVIQLGHFAVITRLVNIRFTKIILWSFHVAIIICLWVFFRAENLTAALDYLAVMFRPPDKFSDQAALVFIGCGALMGLHYLESHATSLTSRFSVRRWNQPLVWGFLLGICLWLVLLPSYSQNPFIYFRF